jgi:hypothetical protein
MTDLDPRYWWRLGDGGLTAADEQGSNDGAYVNGVTRSVEGAILGDADTAAEFRGSTDYINLGEIGIMDGSLLTFGCWARADAWAVTNPRLMSRSSGTDVYERRWQLSVTNGQHLQFDLKLKNTPQTLVGNTQLELGQWFFVVCVFNKAALRMRIYLNGELDATWENVLNEEISDSDKLEVWIGDCPFVSGQRPWEGPIDEAFIIKGIALTPVAVKELYDARIPNVEVISWDD